MAKTRPDQPLTEPVYRYGYTGVERVCFPDLTADGVGFLETGAEIEISVAFAHGDLDPLDALTIAATAELVAARDESSIDPVDDPPVDAVPEVPVDDVGASAFEPLIDPESKE